MDMDIYRYIDRYRYKIDIDSDTSIKSSNIFQFSSPRQVEKNTATIAELSIFTDSNIANSENTALLKKVAHTKTKISVLHQMLYLDFKSEICPKNEEHSKIIS